MATLIDPQIRVTYFSHEWFLVFKDDLNNVHKIERYFKHTEGLKGEFRSIIFPVLCSLVAMMSNFRFKTGNRFQFLRGKLGRTASNYVRKRH